MLKLLRLAVEAAYLDAKGSQDGLSVHQVLVTKVVQATLLEDLGTSLEPHRLCERHT